MEEKSSSSETIEEKEEKKSNKIILIIILFLLLLIIGTGLIFYFVFYDKNELRDTNMQDKAEEDEMIDEETDISQFDGKTLQIKSSDGKIKGNGYVVFNKETKKLSLEFQALLNDDLPVNGTCGGSVDGKNACDDMIRHEYAQRTISQKDPGKSYGVFLFPVLCNKDKMLNKDKFEDFIATYEAKACGIDPQVQEATSTFLIRGKEMEFNSYEEILGLYDVVVYDSSQYWTETTDPNKEYKVEGTREFRLDSNSSILSKNEFRKYVIEIKE